LKNIAKNKWMNFDKMLKREWCFVYFNKSINGICTGKNWVYLVWEAAWMISPSSLEWISYAMESASILAEILNKNWLENSVGRKYFLKTLKIRLKLFWKLLKFPFIYNSFLRWIVMKSWIKTIKK
jgi:flavin-dependent dehydrogenase